MTMPFITRVVGFLLVLLGVVSYIGTGGASITALIPAFVGAIFLLLALIARNPATRKHVMHAAVAIALLAVAGGVPRIITAVNAGDLTRPAVLAQIAMAVILAAYVVLGVKSFIDARRARGG
ncbi:MAG TPA: hypothetical protein VMO26_15155 [Vicinamibacterales bacterium]|nr:hypothetical protein [Vicinamibacterales bacterium]